MTYEQWRITFQSSEQAARAAFSENARLREALECIANGPYVETREIARAALENGDE